MEIVCTCLHFLWNRQIRWVKKILFKVCFSHVVYRYLITFGWMKMKPNNRLVGFIQSYGRNYMQFLVYIFSIIYKIMTKHKSNHSSSTTVWLYSFTNTVLGIDFSCHLAIRWAEMSVIFIRISNLRLMSVYYAPNWNW